MEGGGRGGGEGERRGGGMERMVEGGGRGGAGKREDQNWLILPIMFSTNLGLIICTSPTWQP